MIPAQKITVIFPGVKNHCKPKIIIGLQKLYMNNYSYIFYMNNYSYIKQLKSYSYNKSQNVKLTKNFIAINKNIAVKVPD